MSTDDISAPPFLQLPAEIRHEILTYVDVEDLLRLSVVCRQLYKHTRSDLLWIPLIKHAIPNATLDDADSIIRHRHALTALHPYSFLVRQKIWFSSEHPSGRLMIVRYDPRTKTIEGNSLYAEKGSGNFHVWGYNPTVLIHEFQPVVQLNLNAPIVRINASLLQDRPETTGSKLGQELWMPRQTIPGQGLWVHSRMMLTRPWPHQTSPNSPLWPPHILPANDRCLTQSPNSFTGTGHRPQHIHDMSDSTFRMREWLQMDTIASPGLHFHEQVYSWSTLPREAYTPTKAKPWRGIWVGDYSGHGCEFLVILQPDDPAPLPDSALECLRSSDDNDNDDDDDDDSTTIFNTAPETPSASPTAPQPPTAQQQRIKRAQDAQGIYTGRIEAIKLTGDPNVPRGEYTFLAPDLGDGGFIRIADDARFAGARVVRSCGHIADTGFRQDRYVRSQLILTSTDRIAQYWLWEEGMRHISHYERVDIDRFARV